MYKLESYIQNKRISNEQKKRETSAVECSKFNTLPKISQSKSKAVLHKRVRISRYVSEKDQNAVSISHLFFVCFCVDKPIKIKWLLYGWTGRFDISVRICVNQLDNH